MEEIQKKAKKVNSIKKDAKNSRPKASTKKDAKNSKPKASTKKDVETLNARATTKKAKESDTKKEAKTKKSTTTAKSTKASKVSSDKKTTKTSKTTTTKENNIPLKPSNKKMQTSSKKKSDIIEQTKSNKVKEEPKLTVAHEKEEQNIIANSQEIKKEKSVKEKAPKQKNKQQKENKPKKEKKQYIDISIGAILCTIIIVALLVLNIKLGVRAYNIVTKNEDTNYEDKPREDISVTQEVGNVVDSNNELVEEMKEKITFAPNVVASIYNAEPFSTNTIPNDLKLRIGWAKVKNEDKLRSINEKNEDIEALEKETMEESIKNILGPQVKCKHEDFENTNISTFSTHAQNKGTIYYSEGLYKSIVDTNVEEHISPLIYQEMQKVVKYNEKVIVYVKVAYMDAKENKYIAYKDFNDNKFEEELAEFTSEELFGASELNQYTGEGTVSSNPNSALDGIREQLDTYKYTFTLDQETGTYYLSKFNKALSIQ